MNSTPWPRAISSRYHRKIYRAESIGNWCYLAQYVAMFEWAHNLKRVTHRFLRILMISRFIYLPT